MSFDDVCALISTEVITDEIGQQIKSAEELTEIFCNVKSASSNEFYRAASNDIKAEKVIETDKENYSGQQVVVHESIKYAIYRTYIRQDGVIELYCTQKAGVLRPTKLMLRTWGNAELYTWKELEQFTWGEAQGA